MDRYNWQDRDDYRENRRRDRGNERRLDESQYRGAYRLDTEGRDRDESTYYGFDRDNRNRDRYNQEHGGDYVYRRSRNLQDNDNYTEYQYRQSDSRLRQGGRDNFGSRYGGDGGMRDHDSRHDRGRDQGYGSRIAGNFDGDYAPDKYGRGRGENYGNMAGSLSFGYDGDNVSDPDYNRRYNPLTGEMRSYRDSYTERHPRRYGPPDRTGSNPDYDRY